MTPIDRFERRLPDQLDTLAAARTPAYLDDLLTRTAATRQRPRWAFSERWLPMTIALRRPWSATPVRLFVAGLALLVLLVSAGLAGAALLPREDDAILLLAGRSGGVVVESDGDLWTWDPATDERTLLVENGVWPVWAPDGERLFFLRPDGETDLPMVWRGGSVIPWSDAVLREVQTISWSPDSEAVAIGSIVDGRPAATLLREDGEVPGFGLPQTDLDWPAWKPDSTAGSWRVLVRSRTQDDASARGSLIVTEGKDGAGRTSGRPFLDPPQVDVSVGPLSVLSSEWDVLGATWNPVPVLSQVAYTQLHSLGTDAPDGNGFRVHVFDGITDRALEFDPAADDEGWPAWGPAGQHVAFQSYEGSTGSSRIVVTASAGEWCPDGCLAYVASDPIPVGGPNDLTYAWSPDGAELLVVDTQASTVWRMDAATGALTRLGWTASWVDWQ